MLRMCAQRWSLYTELFIFKLQKVRLLFNSWIVQLILVILNLSYVKSKNSLCIKWNNLFGSSSHFFFNIFWKRSIFSLLITFNLYFLVETCINHLVLKMVYYLQLCNYCPIAVNFVLSKIFVNISLSGRLETSLFYSLIASMSSIMASVVPVGNVSSPKLQKLLFFFCKQEFVM